ncbi:hypothetical protein Ndes2437B_g07999 [Nannochloris sp. 'desiccata']
MPIASRSKLKTSTVTIPVEPDWLTPKQNSVIAVQFIKQFLFLRGQLPSLYDALLAQEQQENLSLAQSAVTNGRVRGPSNRRRGRDQRRRTNFLASAEALFTSLTTTDIFSSTAETSVFLLLGPSTSAPREVFELIFPASSSASNCSSEDGDQNEDDNISGQNRLEPVLQARCRQIMRDFMMQAFNLPEGTAPDRRCKIFILSSAHGSETPPGFKVRRDFQLRKGVHTRIVLQQDSFDDLKSYKMPRQAYLQSTAKLQGLVQPLHTG